MQVAESERTRAAEIERTLGVLKSVRLFKLWNVYATRFFYFASPGRDVADDGDYRLSIECPWRFERHGRILVGSEDYWLKADGNEDPDWSPTEAQSGHLDDQRLEEIMGETKNGSIFASKAALIVQAVQADDVGGFRLNFSNGYRLSVFPASGTQMEWLFSYADGGNLALMKGSLSGSLHSI